MKVILALSLLLFQQIISAIEMTVENIEIVDSHIHFFDTSRPDGVMWPPKRNKVLHVPTLPEHYKEIVKENNVKKAVVVQASNWVSDANWNLKVTENEADLYAGVVCNLSTLGTKQFRKDIDKLIQNPRAVGIRITHPPKDRKFYSAQLIKDLKYIAEHNMSLDILHARFESDTLIEIAKQLPELNIMIGLSGKKTDLILELERLPNVFCKFTNDLSKSETRKNFEIIWQKFGPDRIVFGSNWPATKLTPNGYAQTKKALFDILKEKGDDAVKKVFYDNALKFYQLENGRKLK
ncbi:hypothetical protein LNTAR_22359 [Lentisphaera araneosa HTCC2155]|uniref:Amidohydrolase-related domain-containing protein n=1 Tax=Lentisphaera araneosa HTCC2155 TaxID=313628 RepID=A6DG63_9BACT|nr:amidohydrolase family protein [Lentisphaera araneosa]EDM29180.1 hypothetical protein LNTAR_22359 [Lentisphaera araneosa HTCC2155]